MAKKVLIWGGSISVLCLVVIYMACLGALQEQRVEKLQYGGITTTTAGFYWNHFHLPPFSALSRFLFLSLDSQKKDEQAQVHKSEAEREKERSKGKVLIEAVKESLEEAKLTMEEFANTAAEVVGEVVHKVVDRSKKTLSKPTFPSSKPPQDDEL